MLEPRIRDLAVKVSARAWLLLLIGAVAMFIGLPLRLYDVMHLLMPLPILFFVLATLLRQPYAQSSRITPSAISAASPIPSTYGSSWLWADGPPGPLRRSRY